MVARIRVRLGVALALAALLGVVLTAAAAQKEERLPASAPVESLPAGSDDPRGPFGSERGREQFAELVREAEARERSKAERLASPASVKERQRSKAAFLGLTDGAAVQLLEDTFGKDVDGAAAPDLEELADGRRVERYLDDRTVVFAGADGRPPALVELPQVVRTVDETGQKRPVDLAIERGAAGFSPANAATDVVMPGQLEEGLTVGQVKVAPEGVAAGALSPGGEQVVYPNAQIDTDIVAKPVTAGVELFWQLRSARAPEEVVLDLDVPDGATLEQADAPGAPVAVTNDGETVATVSAPVARDAQGQDVAVDMAVRGDRLVLTARHREQDLAYPLLVDPIVEDWYAGGACTWFNQCASALADLGLWDATHSANVPADRYLTSDDCREGLGLGCFMWHPTNYDYYKTDGLHYYLLAGNSFPAGSNARRFYEPPGVTTRVTRADFGVKYLRQNSTGQRPYMFAGIWLPGAGQWVPGAWTGGDNVSNHWNAVFAGGYAGPQQVTFGFATVTGATINASNQGYMGSAIIEMTDPEAPTITEVGEYHSGKPVSGWVGDDVLEVFPVATDPGLGVYHFRLVGHGVGDVYETLPCNGTWDAPCPYEASTSQPIHSVDTSQLADGRYGYQLRVIDPIWNTGVRDFEVKVDRSRPTVGLSGGLFAGKEDPVGSGTPVLGAGTHALTVNAQDPAPPSAPGAGTSGVKKIVVKVDGDVVATDDGTCPAGGCSRSYNWSLNTATYGGKRTIRVEATDEAGNVGSKAFVVNLPSRGELTLPVDGESTSSRLALQAQAHEDGFTGAEFQYRELPSGLWKTIGGVGTMLRDDRGNVVIGTSQPLDQPGRKTKKLVWDARTAIDLALLSPNPGPLQIRAVFAGNGGHTSKAVNVALDRKGLSAGNAQEEIGPGTVDLLTGNFSYVATDAALTGFGQGLTLTRAHNSLDPEAGGVDAPLGPGWVMSAPVEGVSDYSSLVELAGPGVDGWVDVRDAAGEPIRFERLVDDSFKPEPGFEDLTLAVAGSGYTLTDLDGTVTTFATLAGSTAPVQFVPSKVQEAGDQGVSSFKYELYAGRPQLKRVIAPAPPGLDCGVAIELLPRGCKVLELDYGDINLGALGQHRRLKALRHKAWDPATAVMRVETVAQLAYYEAPTDPPTVGNFGRLKESWDPRVAPALKERYSYDSTGRIVQVTPPGEAAWQIGYVSSGIHGGKLNTVQRTATGSGTEQTSIGWAHPISGAGAMHDMSAAVLDTWGQSDRPTDATVLADSAPSGTLSTVHYLNQEGREVNLATPGLGIATSEYDRYGNVVRALSAEGRQRALGYGAGSATAAGLLSTHRTYSTNGLRLLEELGPEHAVKLDSGQVVDARAHTVTAYDEGSTLPAGKPAHLPTTVSVGAQTSPSDPDVDVRTTKTEYDWGLRSPTKVVADATAGGLNVTERTSYNSAGLEVEARQPRSNGADAGTTKTVYYSHDGSSPDAACRNRPEWFNLACKEAPAGQPDTAGLPDLPVTTYAYDRFGQVTTATDTVGAATRTTTTTYDDAGRQLSTAVSTSDTPSTGMVGAWGFEEASGTSVTDKSAQGNHGTIQNASRSGQGRFGRAIAFDGVDDLVRVADNSSLDITGELTLEAWLRPDPVTGVNFADVVGKPGTGTPCTQGIYALRVFTGVLPGSLPVAGRCMGGAASPTSTIRPGAWTHMAMTVDAGSQVRLYLDGKKVATNGVQPLPLINAADLLIGSSFAGLVDEVRLYNRKLSIDEIGKDMRAPVDPVAVAQTPPPVPQSGLVAAFGLEEDSDSQVVADSSANDNDGELGGATRVGGRHGAAIDTSEGMAVVPDPAGDLSMDAPMTIEAWVGLDPGSGPGAIAGKSDAYLLRVNAEGDLEFAIDPTESGTFLPENTVVAVGPGALASGRMTHAAATYDGETLRLYLDGQLAGEEEAVASGPGGNEPFTIGGVAGDAPLAATIDEVRVYDRELSASEVAQDAAARIALPIVTDSTLSTGYPVATTTYGYSSTTGRPTTVSAPGATMTTGYDNVGRITSYTDADAITSTTSYDRLNRPVTTSDGKGSQTRSYSATTGLLTSVNDSHAGTFTATYDADGRIVSKGYPNGMKADTTFDETGSPVALRYTKTSNCAANCVWLDEQVSESIHGQWRTHEWELSSQEYAYDKVGRLTTVQDDVESPAAAAGCTIRSYSFDQSSNRTALNTKAPAANGDCQPGVAGTSKAYSYDDADRLTGAGLRYDKLGRMTGIPDRYSGGGALTYTYYANDQVRTISQDGVSKTYALDPSGRHRHTLAAGGTTHVESLHYQDGSDSPSWIHTRNTQGQEISWERNIEGIDGDLAAIRTHTAQGDTTVLQLQGLHGDIIATAAADPAAPALTARYETDEYGNPRQAAGATRRFGWLGGKQRPVELASGVIQMGVRSYVPAIGRFTSVDPVDGGSANAYDYAFQDPVNVYDLDGRCPWCVLAVAVGVRVAVVGAKALKNAKRVSRAVRRGGGKAKRAAKQINHGAIANRTIATLLRPVGKALYKFAHTKRGQEVFGRGQGANRGRFRIGLSRHDNHVWFRIAWGSAKSAKNHINLYRGRRIQ